MGEDGLESRLGKRSMEKCTHISARAQVTGVCMGTCVHSTDQQTGSIVKIN